jgi:hypothetical protein
MQPSDYILIGIGVLISFIGYVFKRTLEGIQNDIKELQNKQHTSELNEREIKTKLEACVQCQNRIIDKMDKEE